MANQYYQHFARDAVVAERASEYAAAYQCWQRAAELATNPANIVYAENRRNFCATCNKYKWGLADVD